jgi:small subunit ribosomal protein S3Ae
MGNMGSSLMDISKKIAMIRHVGIRKTKLISSPIRKEGDLSGADTEGIADDSGLTDTEGIADDSGLTDTEDDGEGIVDTATNNTASTANTKDKSQNT